MAIQDTINQGISTVAGALVAEKHLENQAEQKAEQRKANELNFVKQQNNLEFDIDDTFREATNLETQQEMNENAIKNNKIDLEEQKKLNEIAKFTAYTTEPGSPENNKAIDDLKAIGKSMTELNRQAQAHQITKKNIETQFEKLKQIREMKTDELNVLRKNHPELANKYPLGGKK